MARIIRWRRIVEAYKPRFEILNSDAEIMTLEVLDRITKNAYVIEAVSVLEFEELLAMSQEQWALYSRTIKG